MIASRPLRVRCGIGLPQLAEGGCKTPCQRQVEAFDETFAAKPAKGRCFHDHLAGMGGPGRFPAARAVAIQEAVKRAIDLKCDLAADAASPVRRHPYLPNQSKGFGSGSCVSRHVGKRPFSDLVRCLTRVGYALQGGRLWPDVHSISAQAVFRQSKPLGRALAERVIA
jgi:hypothetical protein